MPGRPFPPVEGVRHRFVEVDGLTVHVADAGDEGAEPLVLLHTSFEHWWAWRAMIPILAARTRVLCPDMRGAGWTAAPRAGYVKERLAEDVRGLLDALEIGGVRLVGHGLGGLVGFLLCLRHPGRVRAFVAIGVPPPWPRLDSAFLATVRHGWYQPLVATPGIGPWATRREPGLLDWLFRRTSPHPETWPAPVVAAYRAALREPGRAEAVGRMYRTFLMRELVPLLHGRYRDMRLTTPTLLLLGSEDHFFPPASASGHGGRADELRVEILDGEGHFVHEERPQLVAARVLAFLESAGSSA